jgi:N utilization substance protein B
MPQPVRRRTKAREVALQLLFQYDLRGPNYEHDMGTDMLGLCNEASEGDEEVRMFAHRLVEGTLRLRNEIDDRLKTVTRNWDLKRMASVDRNILRMTVFELAHCQDVPPKVAINEAIELGKKYSTANSGGFVNGILDRVRMDLEKERAAASGAQGSTAATDNSASQAN